MKRWVMGRLVAAAFVAVVPWLPATAAASQVETSAPGYYRMMLVDFEVMAVSDGTPHPRA